MSSTVTWRPFQAAFWAMLNEIVQRPRLDKRSLAVHATTGAGKTIIPVMAAQLLISKRLIDKVVMVVPRDALRKQAAQEFMKAPFRAALGHNLSINEACNGKNLDCGRNGYVTTYQALTTAYGQSDVPWEQSSHLSYFRNHRCLIVPDEVHHVRRGSRTHKAVRDLYNLSAFRVPMSGTLDRHDGGQIALLRYPNEPDTDGAWRPIVDLSFGYRQAITSRAIIRTEFIQYDASGNYLNRKGSRVFFSSLGGKTSSRLNLYTALQTEYARDLLNRAVKHWRAWRSMFPRSKLLIVCASQGQARTVTGWLREMGVHVGQAISDDGPAAQMVIDQYKEPGGYEALVTVAMAYEGLDVKQITHVACLTHVRSCPWLHQMFGRAMRYDEHAGDWKLQWAFIFVPDDPEMAAAIDYVQKEQVLGAMAIGEEAECPYRPAAGGDGSPVLLPPGSTFTPIDSQATHSRISGSEADERLGYEATARVAHIMDQHGLIGAATSFVAAMKQYTSGGLLQSPTEGEILPDELPIPPTPAQRQKALRKQLKAYTNALDDHDKVEPGTWNKRCFLGPQCGVSRKDMSEEALVRVRNWLAPELQRRGINPRNLKRTSRGG